MLNLLIDNEPDLCCIPQRKTVVIYTHPIVTSEFTTHTIMAFVTPWPDSTITPQSHTNDAANITHQRRTARAPVKTQPRKQYRASKRIPRQTLHNRKKRKLLASRSSLHVGGSENPVDENIIADDIECRDDNPSNLFTQETPTTTSATLDFSLSSHCDESCSEDDLGPETRQGLFSDSTISVRTSSMLIRIFMCRHHLTYQAKADLLQLLQVHLPDPNQLPTTLYTFQKMNTRNSVDVDPVVTEHHYCTQCNTVLSDLSNSFCTQCEVPLVQGATPYFITVSIPDQLKVFLKSKYGFSTCACSIIFTATWCSVELQL